jgi:hypothetical protein
MFELNQLKLDIIKEIHDQSASEHTQKIVDITDKMKSI